MDILSFESFLVAFSTIFLMEMGDKTQLTSFTLAVHYQSRRKVFLGVITGLSAITLFGVVLGFILK